MRYGYWREVERRVVLTPGGFVASLTVKEEQAWDKFCFEHPKFQTLTNLWAERDTTHALVIGGDRDSADSLCSLLRQSQESHKEWHEIGRQWYAELVKTKESREAEREATSAEKGE
jgi:hypothetical protein